MFIDSTREPHNSPAKFEPISRGVYAFRFGFARGLVVDNNEGLAVFDTFNRGYASALQHQLGESFPGKRVRWVYCSHRHLDHVGGADMLEHQEVIGHADVKSSLDDWSQSG